MHVILIGLVSLVILAFSARWNWWRPLKKGIPILMYHKVGDPPEGSKLKKLWVSSEKFRRHLAYLKKNGYTPITFRDIYQHWDMGADLPEKPVLITFDDGYKNNFETAYPILKEFGTRATIFTVVQTVGGDNEWHNSNSETRVPMVSWEELKILKNEGWEIGSHTMTHPRLLALDVNEAGVELEMSRRVIEEHLASAPPTFAYPYGNGEDSPIMRDAVKKAGYRIAVGIHSSVWPLDRWVQSPYNLPRLFIRGDENNLDFHLQLTRGRSRF